MFYKLVNKSAQLIFDKREKCEWIKKVYGCIALFNKEIRYKNI